jgi:hypothetical protein
VSGDAIDDVSEVPRAFDVAFLEWFRNRTEAEWAALPVEAPDDLVTRYVGWGVGGSSFQCGTRWKDGLPEDEIADMERRWSLRFPPDYRLFLERLHAPDRPMLTCGFVDKDTANAAMPVLARAHWDERQDMVLTERPSFYNWSTDDDAIAGAYEWLNHGLEFDAEQSDLWESGWGPKPASRKARRARIRELVTSAPKLIPVMGHRYLLAEPHAVGNPVFSVYQSDIIVYETDLRTFLIRWYLEFKGLRSDNLEGCLSALRSTEYDESYYESIPFWGSLL